MAHDVVDLAEKLTLFSGHWSPKIVARLDDYEIKVVKIKGEFVWHTHQDTEPTHAIAAAIREAVACKESGEKKVILTALCGHGHLDLASYEQYLSGQMVDYDLPDEQIAAAMKSVPGLG